MLYFFRQTVVITFGEYSNFIKKFASNVITTNLHRF